MPSNATHHRVYLPGQLSNRLPRVLSHPEGCDLDDCPVTAGIAAWLSFDVESPTPIQVQGDYFTATGVTYERCAWQPDRHL